METKKVSEEQLAAAKSDNIRMGWAEAFVKYAEEGEDEMLLPDLLDDELE